jgi:hypothetical protein
MAGLPWIPLATDFPDSRKALALGVALSDPLAWAYVVRLWTWCAKNAADGRIEGPDSVAVLEHAACWKGSPGAFAEAASLPHVRLLDITERGFAIHDWHEHCGAHVEKREKDRERMKRARNANRSRTVREQNAHVRGEREREKEIENTYLVGEAYLCSASTSAPPAKSVEQIERDTARRLGSEARAGLPTQDELRSEKYPKTASVLAQLEALSCPGGWPTKSDTCAAVEAAIGSQSPASVAFRVRDAIKASGKPWLGHHLPEIRGVSAPKAKGMASPSTDWTSEEATKL